MKTKLNYDFFPYGTQYHRAPTPISSEWEEDFAAMQKAGYTHVQFRPQWRCHERIRGQYDFVELHQLCDLALKYQLKVIIKTQLECAPDWVFEDLEGTRIGFHGQKLSPIAHGAFYVGGWWPCFDSPAVQQAAFEFNQHLASEFKDHEALWFFNAWNEPRSRPMGDCQCLHSQKSYQEWLKNKFGTIENLNNFFGKAWTSFDTVRPPQSYSDYCELYLWRQWAEVAVAAKVRLSYEGLKAGAPDKVVMCHVGFSSVTQDPMCDTSNDILNAEQVDFYGCSYPVSLYPVNWVNEHSPLYHSAWMRRVDSEFWIQEFYPTYSNWLTPPETSKVTQIVLLGIATGCQGFTFWQYRSERLGEESNCSGIREIDGSPNCRSIELEAIGSDFLAKHGKKLIHSQVKTSPIGLLYHRRNDMLMRLQTMNSDLHEVGTIKGSVEYSYRMALENAMALYQLKGYNAQILTPEDNFDHLKLLHLSAIELIDTTLAIKLEKFVRQGGILVVEYPFGCRDENLWVAPQRPLHNLEKLTGVKEGLRKILSTGKGHNTFAEGICAIGKAWQIELIPSTDDLKIEEYYENGTVKMVKHKYYEGTVFTSGENYSLSWNRQSISDDSTSFIEKILTHANLPINEEPTRWEVTRQSVIDTWRFIFNMGQSPVSFQVGDGEEIIFSYQSNNQEKQLLPYGAVVIFQNNLEKINKEVK